MVVGVAFELGRGLKPVEVSAEFLDGVEFTDDGQTGFVVGRFRWGEGGVGDGSRGGGEGMFGFGVVVDCPVV